MPFRSKCGLRLVLRKAQPALDAAGLGPRDVAGDSLHAGVVIGVNDDLVVGPDELEHGVDFAHLFRVGGGRGGQQGQDEEALHRDIVGVSAATSQQVRARQWFDRGLSGH